MTSKIQEEVYKLLEELFKDKCPLFKSDNTLRDFVLNPEGLKVYLEYYSKADNIWTILSEILPEEIILKTRHGNKKRYGKGFLFGQFNYFFIPGKAELFDIEEDTTWQSLLSLLEAIKTHPDKDEFEYRWGK